MQTPQLELEVARWSGRPPTELDTRSRALRRAGLLLVAGSGLHAANNTARHVANYVMGLATRKATEAAKGVGVYAPMVPLDRSISGTFGDALSTVLADPLLAEKIHALVLARTGGGHGPEAFAKIVFREGHSHVYVPADWLSELRRRSDQDDDHRSFGVSAICDDVTIGGAWLARMSLKLAGGPSSLLKRAARENA